MHDIHHPRLTRSCAPGASVARNQSFRQGCASVLSAVGRKKWLSSRPLLGPTQAITGAAANAERGWRGSATTQVDATRTAQCGTQTVSHTGPRRDPYPASGLVRCAAWSRRSVSSRPIAACRSGWNGRCRVCRARRARERYWADPDERERQKARVRRNRQRRKAASAAWT